MTAIADLCEINPRHPAGIDSDEIIAFVGMADLDVMSAVARDAEKRPFGEVGKGYTPLMDGDILMAKITPCFENCKIGQADTTTQVAAGSTEFHVMRPGSRLDDRYLLHFLRQPWVRQLGELRMTGSGGQRRVPERFLAELQIPLPPIEEQRRIAAILDAADDLRTKRRQAIANLDTLTQAIFIEMFGDPVSAVARSDTGRLTDLGDLDRGVSKHRPRNDPQLLGGDWPLVQTGDVANAGGYIAHVSSTYSDAGLAQSRLWPAGTLCITIAANIAKTAVLEIDACFPDSVVGFSPHREGDAEYVRIFMNFLQPVLETSAPESAQKNINLKVLRSLPVPIPSYESRRRFAYAVARINDQRKAALASLKHLDTLFASLQQRAFAGEL